MGDLARELDKRGHTVKVLAATPHYNVTQSSLEAQPLESRFGGLVHRSDFHGIPVWHVRVPPKEEKIAARALDYLRFHFLSLIAGMFFVGRYDVIVAPSPPLSVGVIAWLLGLTRFAPSIYNVQEIYPDYAVNQGVMTNRRLIRLMTWLERFVYRVSKKVVVISPWFAKIIAPRGIAEGKLEVIPNFVDTELYRPLPRDNAFSRAHDLNRDFVVLYGGNMGLSQDLESVVHAAKELAHLPIRFVLVGDGVRTKWLVNEIAANQLRNVSYLGYQPRETMPEINASCDLAMIPMKAESTRDTFPSKIYTILACGKSVLVSADENSELEWLIREWHCGRVVPPDDGPAFAAAVLKAYEERDSLGAEGETGRRHVLDKYSKEAVGAEYDRVIADVLRKK
jgi:colanic acid biosynthesis glycosyl transferase WcaI